jgi:hypothetical protein
MPSVAESYYHPAGFLYNYFLAFCFFVFGPKLEPIFLTQSVLISLTIYFTYKTLRSGMGILRRIAFLFTLMLFGKLDVFDKFSFLLLSENLALFSVALFFFFLKKGLKTKNNFSFYFSSALLSLNVLIRPNIFPFTLLFLIALGIYYIIVKVYF